jgi:hypothetical protein
MLVPISRKDILAILTWRSPLIPARSLYYWYVSIMGSMVGSILRAYDRSETVKKMAAIDANHLIRLLVAPETCYHIIYEGQRCPEKTINFIERSLQAEEELVNYHRILSDGIWTALGDWGRSGGIDTEAPLLGGVIPVDGSSPYAVASYAPDLAAPHIMQSEELSTTLEVLRGGLQCLRNVSLTAFAFVPIFTKQLVVRSNPTGEYFSSFSMDRYICRTTLVNPLRRSKYEVADALVHEAVHSLLYMFELDSPLVIDMSAAIDNLVTSPWSGSTLDTHSFIHACFVWYSLWHLWRNCPDSTALEFVDRIERGYANANLGDTVGRYVTREVLGDLEWMRASVLSDGQPPMSLP